MQKVNFSLIPVRQGKTTGNALRKVAVLFLCLVPIMHQQALAADSLSRISIDPTIAQKAPLIKCSIDSQLDCIEKVYVEHKAGVIEEAKYIETRLVDFPTENNQKVQYGDIKFEANLQVRL